MVASFVAGKFNLACRAAKYVSFPQTTGVELGKSRQCFFDLLGKFFAGRMGQKIFPQDRGRLPQSFDKNNRRREKSAGTRAGIKLSRRKYFGAGKNFVGTDGRADELQIKIAAV